MSKYQYRRNSRNQIIDKKGRYASTNMVSVEVSSELQKLAKTITMKVAPKIRDKLVETLQDEIYYSLAPVTSKGQDIKKYNETHKHQKKQPYHQEHLLERSVYAKIEDNAVKACLKPNKYENDRTVREVYDFLKFGTTNTPKATIYSYDNGKKTSPYHALPAHDFEQKTKAKMNEYLAKMADDIRNRRPIDYL